MPAEHRGRFASVLIYAGMRDPLERAAAAVPSGPPGIWKTANRRAARVASVQR